MHEPCLPPVIWHPHLAALWVLCPVMREGRYLSMSQGWASLEVTPCHSPNLPHMMPSSNISLPPSLPSFLQHLCNSSLTQGVPDPCPCVALLPLTCLTQHPSLPTPPHKFITLWSVFPLPTVEGMLCKSQDLFSSLLVTSGERGAIN